jgi:tRNA threonylcarbamoyladenosine biosynthesis protein TsaE
MRRVIKSEDAMRDFASQIAKKLKPGAVLALVGDLGAGKTTFVKGLAKALGVREKVTSPTFVLLKPYVYKKAKKQKSKKAFVHVDAYRVESADELIDIGLDEYLNNDAIVAIEWAGKIKKILPRGRVVWIKFELGKNPEERVVEVVGAKK